MFRVAFALMLIVEGVAFAGQDDEPTGAAQRAPVDGDYIIMEAGETAPEGWSTIDFQLDRPGLKIATKLGTTVGHVSGTRVVATTYQDICLAPCILAIRPGYREFNAYGQGRTPSTLGMDLRRGSSHLVVGKSGSLIVHRSGWTMIGVGLAAVLIGATRSSIGREDTGPDMTLPLIGGGLALAGVGVPLMIIGKSKMEERH